MSKSHKFDVYVLLVLFVFGFLGVLLHASIGQEIVSGAFGAIILHMATGKGSSRDNNNEQK
jgi:hypothetical protein